MDADRQKNTSITPLLLAGALIFGRLMSLLALPLEGVQGYGDSLHFFNLASLPGWPYLSYWAEFPPVFPFLSAVLARLSGYTLHTYVYLLVMLLTAADAASLWVFWQLSQRLHGPQQTWRVLTYLLCMLTLAYFWWYFDSLAVLPLLLGLLWLLQDRPKRAGAVLGVGLLVKLFPVLALAAAWRSLSWRKAAQSTAVAIGLGALVYGGLWLASPSYTAASLQSQANKGSWETVWALLDGNFRTGNFGPEQERLQPATAALPRGNPAVIPSWLTLLPFAALGLWGLTRCAPQGDKQQIALVGFALCLLWLWSPGWSPQWMLFLLPLILLVFPMRMALLLGSTLLLANLMEWPILLSRGMFWSLSLTVPLRALLLALLALMFYTEMRPAPRQNA